LYLLVYLYFYFLAHLFIFFLSIDTKRLLSIWLLSTSKKN
jgi:hypothetical protein